MMTKNLTNKIMINIPNRIQSNTDLNILKSNITLQKHKSILTTDDHMKNQEKKNTVMIKSVDNMRRNLMIILNNHRDTEKTIDTKKIIVIKINPDSKKTIGMTPNTGTNPDIEMIEIRSFLTKKFLYKVGNLHKRKNLPLLIKQWMFNNSIDTWFRIL